MSPIDPDALRRHYSAFLRPDRILLTGHSHQAWPDAARAGLLRAFDTAAAHVDQKWAHVGAWADTLRGAVARQLEVDAADIALGQNAHELVTRFLSALDWDRRRHLVTTDGEFHSMRRQLRRLEETGVAVTWVKADPVDSLGERLAAAVRPDTAAVMASTVLFRTSAIVPHLSAAIDAAHRHGAQVLLDAYHAFNVVPQPRRALGADPVFIVGGGYKYAQWGEGCCWLRVPPGCTLRPVHTG
ncbi:MAG: aminotransferase class V-fold PLP-dependent enzyme, partial [Myxococcales bacterium]|nr:aminotransferase class V-fold PLP-dependent enzyme [Myxococcales bacterium]